MVSGILITTISVALLSFWFRYSCLRVLRGQQPVHVPFTMKELGARLRNEGHLEDLRQSLDRDYQLVAFVLDHSPASRASLEHRMLLWDYRAMKWWYRLTRNSAPGQATQALLEMSSIVGILASQMPPTTGMSMRS